MLLFQNKSFQLITRQDCRKIVLVLRTFPLSTFEFLQKKILVVPMSISVINVTGEFHNIKIYKIIILRNYTFLILQEFPIYFTFYIEDIHFPHLYAIYLNLIHFGAKVFTFFQSLYYYEYLEHLFTYSYLLYFYFIIVLKLRQVIIKTVSSNTPFYQFFSEY